MEHTKVDNFVHAGFLWTCSKQHAFPRFRALLFSRSSTSCSKVAGLTELSNNSCWDTPKFVRASDSHQDFIIRKDNENLGFAGRVQRINLVTGIHIAPASVEVASSRRDVQIVVSKTKSIVKIGRETRCIFMSHSEAP